MDKEATLRISRKNTQVLLEQIE